MDATIDRAALADALARAAGAVAGRTTKPVLAGVLVRADHGGVTLAATDTEVGVTAALPPGQTVGRPGAAVVSHAKLVQIVREADAPTVRLTAADTHGVTVTAGGRWELPGYDPAEFPESPAFPAGDSTHEVEAGVLRAMIRRTAFAADKKDSTRFALSGVLWEAEGKTVRLVATDSKRLSVCEGPAVVTGDAPKGTHLLPSKAVALLLANLGDDGELVRVCLRANGAMFRTERATLHTALVSGRYPPYRDLLTHARKGDPTRIVLPVAAFLSRVRQAAVMADDESKRIDMVFGGGRVTMACRGAATGSSDVAMELPDYTGPAVSIAFDPAYVAEFLRAADGEPTVTLDVTDGSKPALFRCGGGWSYLVMPLAG